MYGFLAQIRDLIDKREDAIDKEDTNENKELMNNLVRPLKELLGKWRSGMCENCLPNYLSR